MLPIYDSGSHTDYCVRVWRMLEENDLLQQLPDKYLDIVQRFCDMDLTEVDRIMQDRYSPRDRTPRQPSDLLRSMLLSAAWGIGSYTKWARTLKTVPFLAIVSGFKPGDVPGVGTFYDFIDRLWLASNNNFQPDVQPQRKKPPKPARKGEKAPSVENLKVTE